MNLTLRVVAICSVQELVCFNTDELPA